MGSIQDRLALTPEQVKVFKRFEKAREACIKAGIYFLPWEDFAYAVNGNNVEEFTTFDSSMGVAEGYERLSLNNDFGDHFVEHETNYINTDVYVKFKED